MKRFDVCVRGAGVVGRSLALSLARLGLRIALQGEAPRAGAGSDIRTYALNPASVALLSSLRVWEALPADAVAPVYDMRVEGDAPGAALDFSAWQQHVRELAWIVDAAALDQQLANAVRFAPHVSELPARASVEAELLAVCEGKASASSDALGAPVERHDYGQTAVAARLVATRTHQGIARQWFRSPDVLALLPFDRPSTGHSYGLVWSLPSERARELMALDAQAFEAALLEATGGLCGDLRLAGARAAWPLCLARAERWCGPGWVLLGDAAHVVHPLAGQGLNLGLADVRVLSRVIGEREAWRGVGDARLLRRYAREREVPTRAMARLTDGLLQLFASRSAGVRELRNRGLTLVNQFAPLKRWLTARALDQ
jgi:2-polyprenyl-6-methoxyphenol hydroxylase-like FAD-dependent oxidoreductase